MRTQLEETLDQLRAQLAELEHVDPQQRAELQATVDELQQSLDHHDVNSQSLADRLNEATLQFQESHPSLTSSVGRIADMLAQMGI